MMRMDVDRSQGDELSPTRKSSRLKGAAKAVIAYMTEPNVNMDDGFWGIKGWMRRRTQQGNNKSH